LLSLSALALPRLQLRALRWSSYAALIGVSLLIVTIFVRLILPFEGRRVPGSPQFFVASPQVSSSFPLPLPTVRPSLFLRETEPREARAQHGHNRRSERTDNEYLVVVILGVRGLGVHEGEQVVLATLLPPPPLTRELHCH